MLHWKINRPVPHLPHKNIWVLTLGQCTLQNYPLNWAPKIFEFKYWGCTCTPWLRLCTTSRLIDYNTQLPKTTTKQRMDFIESVECYTLTTWQLLHTFTIELLYTLWYTGRQLASTTGSSSSNFVLATLVSRPQPLTITMTTIIVTTSFGTNKIHRWMNFRLQWNPFCQKPVKVYPFLSKATLISSSPTIGVKNERQW